MVKLRSVAYSIQKMPLHLAFVIYMTTLRFFERQDITYDLDKWQWKDFWQIFRLREICLNRARGASKTRDMALLAVFFALRFNEIKWFAPTTIQLNQAKKYWYNNPFVVSFNIHSKQVFYITLTTGFSFDIAITTTGHMKGGRANIVFFDEMALMTPDMLGDIIPVTNGMDRIGDGVFLLFFSTPLINTVFEEYTTAYPTLTHDWREPSWFNKDRLLRLKTTMSPSKWKTEYECIFAAADGQCFEENLTKDPYVGPMRPMVYYGSDPNPREGYCLVGVQYSADLRHIVVKFAKNFGANVLGKHALFDYLIPLSHQHHNVHVELEDNGVGKPTWDDYIELNGEGDRIDWGTSGAGDKVARVNEMSKYTIHFDLDNPELSAVERRDMKRLWSQANAVRWSKDGTKIDKDPNLSWHLADSWMHACAKGFEVRVQAVAQPVY